MKKVVVGWCFFVIVLKQRAVVKMHEKENACILKE